MTGDLICLSYNGKPLYSSLWFYDPMQLHSIMNNSPSSPFHFHQGVTKQPFTHWQVRAADRCNIFSVIAPLTLGASSAAINAPASDSAASSDRGRFARDARATQSSEKGDVPRRSAMDILSLIENKRSEREPSAAQATSDGRELDLLLCKFVLVERVFLMD